MLQAKKGLKKYLKGDELDFDFKYSGAISYEKSVADEKFDSASFLKAVDVHFNKLVSIGKNVEVGINKATGMVWIKGTAAATGGVLTGQAGKFAGPIWISDVDPDAGEAGEAAAYGAPVNVNGDEDAAFAMGLYGAVISALQDCCGLTKKKMKAYHTAAGIQKVEDYTEHAFGGHFMPQIDVNRFVDGNNKEGVVASLYATLLDAQGWTRLNKEVMLEDLRLAKPEEVHKGRREAPPRLGLASQSQIT